jgi:hypothetical protein
MIFCGKEFVTNNSVVISGRSPLKISNRWKLNSNLKGISLEYFADGTQ